MVRILSGRSGLQLAYLGMGVAAGILTWVLAEHRSNHPNILGYSFEYFLLLLFVATIGLILLLAAILASILFPGLLGPIVWLGLIVFILVYVLFFSRPSVNAEQRWRGRPVGPQSSARRGDSSWYRFRRWLKR